MQLDPLRTCRAATWPVHPICLPRAPRRLPIGMRVARQPPRLHVPTTPINGYKLTAPRQNVLKYRTGRAVEGEKPADRPNAYSAHIPDQDEVLRSIPWLELSMYGASVSSHVRHSNSPTPSRARRRNALQDDAWEARACHVYPRGAALWAGHAWGCTLAT
jgi:hypothetical protein